MRGNGSGNGYGNRTRNGNGTVNLRQYTGLQPEHVYTFVRTRYLLRLSVRIPLGHMAFPLPPNTLQHCFEASRVSIRVNADLLEPVDAFPYFGHTITYNNSDWSAMYHDLWKACRIWGIISKVLMKT